MSTITLRDDVTVLLRESMGGDDAIIEAMLVSTLGPEVMEELEQIETTFGRINFLMKNRHGSPFEHGAFRFYVEAPISVFREFHRHRIGWSYNEMSGRYKKLEPTFYIPRPERPLVQIGKPGHYEFVAGSELMHADTVETLRQSYQKAYDSYEAMLTFGVAKEVARQCLPVGLYSSMYATCNPRSLMSFLSLRTKDVRSMFPSFPMDEIELVAHEMELVFEDLYPLTYRAFNENGRVAP